MNINPIATNVMGIFFKPKTNTMPNENEDQNGVTITPPPTNNPQAPAAEQPANTWYFDDKEDEAMGIETYRYDNGGVSKRCKLSDGRTAVCHRLKGSSRQLIKRICGDDQNKFDDALIAVSTKVDDKGIVLEDLENMWFNDAMTLQTMARTLNFT